MGMGQETAGGAGMGGGYSMNVPGGASGMSGGGPSIAGGGGDMSQIAALLQDPQVLKSLGGFASSLGNMKSAHDKIPPHVAQMIGEGIRKLTAPPGQPTQQGSADSLNPYGGDMAKYITPDMAMHVLDSMGIPYGKMRGLQ